MFSEFDQQCMQQALSLAEQAASQGEVPVGAVLTLDERVIATAHNQPIALHDPTAHAEILALRAAAKELGNYRLVDSTLYVTLEPCAMCAGAIVHARVGRLVVAASDPKTGACGSILTVLNNPALNHRVDYQSGLLAEQASAQLRAFFKARR